MPVCVLLELVAAATSRSPLLMDCGTRAELFGLHHAQEKVGRFILEGEPHHQDPHPEP
jgi:hypothetical protein